MPGPDPHSRQFGVGQAVGFGGVVSSPLKPTRTMLPTDLAALASGPVRTITYEEWKRRREKRADPDYDEEEDDDGEPPLWTAAKRGQTERARELVAAGAPVNKMSHDYRTALWVAAFKGHAGVARVLVGAGADVNRPGAESRRTPLYQACAKGHAEVAAVLLDADADPDKPDDHGGAPLHAAAYGQHAAIVDLLIARGADVNHARHNGSTPLLLAAFLGDRAICAALLVAGARVNHAARDGATALHGACGLGHLACVQLLSSYGARRTTGLGFFRRLTAEQMALANSHERVVCWLLLSRDFTTPLHHLDCLDRARARALLRDGADIHAAADDDAPTPLCLARDLRERGEAPDGSPADLVLQAARPWSAATHAVRAAAARARAVELMLIGARLTRDARFDETGEALFQAWLHRVMPFLDMSEALSQPEPGWFRGAVRRVLWR